MKPKHQRLVFILSSLACVCLGVLLILRAFSSNLVFFFSPSDVAAHPPAAGQLVRVGGLVEAGSIKRGNDERLTFTLTDGAAHLVVHYQGMLPNLFREGQGAVAEGYVEGGVFQAKRVLTKHDEKYMPREVMDALKKSGRWREQGQAP